MLADSIWFVHLFAAAPVDRGLPPVEASLLPDLFRLLTHEPLLVPVALAAAASYWIFVRLKGRAGQAPAQPAPAAAGTSAGESRIPNRRSRLGQAACSQIASEHLPPTDDADIMVLAPAVGPPGDEILAQVFVHTPDEEEAALRAGRKLEPGAELLASRPLEVPLRSGDKIKLTLESDTVAVDDPVQEGSWNGRWVCFYFMLRLPDTGSERTVASRLRVFVNGTPAGIVIFKIKVMPRAPDLLPSFVPQDGRAWKRYFVSYASEDRVEVLKAVQMMKVLKADIFQDLLTMSPGDRWQRRLFVEIEKCDVFMLFWSHYARQSEWVIREAEYALSCSQAARAEHPLEIVPVLLEGPPPPPPPDSLRAIHFNDPIRYVIFAAEHAERSPPPASPSPPQPAARLCLCIGPVSRALEVGTRIEPQLLGAAGAIFGTRPIAEAIPGREGSGGLGLRNLSTMPLRATLPNGTIIEVAPGHAVRLTHGLIISFGEIAGVIRNSGDSNG
jgi:hypothetical protein